MSSYLLSLSIVIILAKIKSDRKFSGTYLSRKPWPPARSGCRRSWPWWSHSGQSSWWQGRWRSVSFRRPLPHDLPSSLCQRRRHAIAGGVFNRRNSSWLRMTSRPEESDAEKKSPFLGKFEKKTWCGLIVDSTTVSRNKAFVVSHE